MKLFLILILAHTEIPLEELFNLEVKVVSKYEEKIREAPSALTVITREEMENLGLRKISDVLNYCMGTLVWDTRDYEFAVFRGLVTLGDYNTRVLILLDGHIINEGWNSSVPIGDDFPIPFEAIEKIEIIRGAGSSIYGTSAFMGVINIVTKKEGKKICGNLIYPKRGGELRGLISKSINKFNFYAYGSFADILYPDLNLPKIKVDYPVNYEGDSIYGGIAKDVDFSKRYFVASGVNTNNLDLKFVTYKRTVGTPYADYNAVYGEKENKIIDFHQFIDLFYQKSFNTLNLTVRAFWDHYFYNDFYHYADPESSIAPKGYVTPWKGEPFWWGVELMSLFSKENLKLSAGFAYQHKLCYQKVWFETLDGKKIRELKLTYPKVTQDIYSPFGEIKFSQKFGVFSFGARYDRYSDYGGIIAPRIGASLFLPKEIIFKMVYAKAFRAPSVYEAYMEDSLSTAANPFLKPEIIESGEMQIMWAGKSIYLSSGVFGQEIYNGITSIVENKLEKFVNQKRLRVRGLESEIRFRLKNFETFTSGTFSRVYILKEKFEILEGTPEFFLKSGIIFKDDKFSYSLWGIIKGSYLDREGNKVKEDYILNTSFTLNIRDGVGMRFLIKNLTNSDYKTPLSDVFTPLYSKDRGRRFSFELFFYK
ncbi:MAG: TonB-dependent receptor [Candidatus Hydrothermales bacterium]